jgi:glycine/D-amino acid oxidase-like deaminating enzyme
MGGGVIGSCVAYSLVRKHGWSVTLVDPCASEDGSPFEPPAASGRAGGFLARAWCDGQATEKLTRLSFDLHSSKLQHLDSDYRRVSCCSAKDVARVRNKHKYEQCDDDGATITPSYCNLLDQLSPFTQSGTTSDCAQVTPEKFVRSLQEETMRFGTLNILRGKVVGVTHAEQQQGVEVRVEKENGELVIIEADSFVAAAGPWTNQVRSFGPLFHQVPQVEGLKAHSIVVGGEEAKKANPVALFLSVEQQQSSSSRYKEYEYYPRPDGTLYVCGEGEEDSSIVEESPGSVSINKDAIQSMACESSSKVSTMFKNSGTILRESACHLPIVISATGTPLICEVALGSHVYIATGHSCWGILQGPGTGKALAELIANGECECLDLSAFQLPTLSVIEKIIT